MLAQIYFAFVTMRSGAGRVALVLMVAVLVQAVFVGLSKLMGMAGWFFPYTSGAEGLYMFLATGSTTVWTIKSVATLVAAIAFLILALREKNPGEGEGAGPGRIARVWWVFRCCSTRGLVFWG